MHPLAPNLTSLTDEEIHTKRAELQNKLMFSYRSGNSNLVAQIQMLLQDYDIEIQTRNQRMLDQLVKTSKNFGNVINISK